jgi:hypothetical protein
VYSIGKIKELLASEEAEVLFNGPYQPAGIRYQGCGAGYPQATLRATLSKVAISSPKELELIEKGNSHRAAYV